MSPRPERVEAGWPESDRPWRILEFFAQRAPLDKVLDEVLLLLEERYFISRCAILELRDGRLECVASAGLTGAILSSLNLSALSGNGAASARWVDFAAPAWEALRAMPAMASVAVRRMEPILSADGEILGEVVGFAEAGTGEENLREALRLAARISGFAIEHRHLMEDLLYNAHHDAVTLLPNRFLLEERLAEAMSAADRAGTGVALLNMDLDRFQTVNDLLGRGIGDLLLEEAARRMKAGLAAEETLARTAGDEFSAVLPGVDTMDQAVCAAERLRARLGAPFALSGHELIVTASIGCALYPQHAGDAASLDRCADAALYRAKHAGRNCVRGFVPGAAASARQRAHLESAMANALERNEFRLLFQPQVSLPGIRLSGAEALLRWQHPVIGFVSPLTFVPIAEETGLIVPLGAWALREACRCATAWFRSGFRGRVAVNVSAVQFAQDGFVEEVKSILNAAEASPEALELELTESVLVGDVREAAAKMRELRSLGLTLALDDFGTGYSSLSHIQDLPLDIIKIDTSFVRQITGTEDRSPVIETIVSMAHTLGKKLVAEGVETRIQQEYLTALGCDTAQGYLYDRPAPAEEFAAKWIR